MTGSRLLAACNDGSARTYSLEGEIVFEGLFPKQKGNVGVTGSEGAECGGEQV